MTTIYPWQEKATISVPEACKVLGISRSLGFKMVKEGKLQAIRLGERRLVVPTAVITRMLVEAVGQ